MRQRQELDPIIDVLSQLQHIETNKENKTDAVAFTKQIKSIKSFAELADNSLTKISSSEENWFFKTFMKLVN